MLRKRFKKFLSEGYNYVFDRLTGAFARWGNDAEHDPEYSPFGPEILDIEVSTICNKGCSHCYKSNTSVGKNMSLETFKQLFMKFPKTLTQIAFGIGDLSANPDLFDIFSYCRKNDVVPNVTVNGSGLTEEATSAIAELCGAVAVSYYDDASCFNAVKKFTDKGMRQVNIHCLLSEETYEKCMELITKSKVDERLVDLNAIVFLLLKPKGQRNYYHCLKDKEKYKRLIDYAFELKAKIGFDSCSANSFIEAIKDKENSKELTMCADPCESSLFSYYINVDGVGFPCSFSEGAEGCKGIDVLNSIDFMRDVWNNEETRGFRSKLLGNCRNCPVYDLTMT